MTDGDELQPNATAVAAFRWTPQREKAALLLGQGNHTDAAVAAEVGLKDDTTLWRWKRQPAFMARIEEHATEIRDHLKAEGIANKQNRVAVYRDRHERIQRLIDARAEDLDGEVPGGVTGLLVREAKFVKVYEVKEDKDAVDEDGQPTTITMPTKRVELVYEYRVDAALLREDRATLEQAAKELGQWTEKQEVTGKDGGPIEIDDARERLAALVARHVAAAGAGQVAEEPDA